MFESAVILYLSVICKSAEENNLVFCMFLLQILCILQFIAHGQFVAVPLALFALRCLAVYVLYWLRKSITNIKYLFISNKSRNTNNENKNKLKIIESRKFI